MRVVAQSLGWSSAARHNREELPVTPAALIPLREQPLSEKPIWSLRDAARATTLSIRTLQKLIAAGRVPANKIGRRVLLDPAAVRQALCPSED